MEDLGYNSDDDYDHIQKGDQSDSSIYGILVLISCSILGILLQYLI